MNKKEETKKRKRKRKTEVEPPPPPEPKIDPRFWLPNHLKEWVNLRSKPKVIAIRQKKRKLTRFQKKGPNDPKKIRKWYKKQMRTLQNVYEKTLMLAEKVKNEKTKRRIRRRNLIQFIDWERLEELAWPKWFIKKYIIPLEEDFPYAPRIHKDKPARKGKARPFIQKQIPRAFMHDILEMDFWYEYRFPVNKDAKKFKATSRELRMSIPKSVPPDPEQEAGPPRQKMPKSRWLQHLEYLKFFASAKSKMYPRKKRAQPKRGRKICLRYLQSGIERLAIPKVRCELEDKDFTGISKRAMSAKASEATQRLAIPKKRLDEQCCRKDPYEISRSAKSATASARIIELSVPKKDRSLSEKLPNKPLSTKKRKSQYSYTCSKREKYPCINYNNLIS